MTWTKFSCALLLLLATVVRAESPSVEGFRWEQLPQLPMGVVAPAASISGNLLVVTGGLTLTGTATDMVQVMDLDTRSWVRTYQLAQPRDSHAQVTLDDGRVLVVGGRSHNAAGRMPRLASCELVDPTNGVAAAADMPDKIANPTLHKLDDGRVVVAGSQMVAVYDPATDTWSEPMALHQPRESHTAVLVRPRKLLVIGGTGMRTFERADLDAGRIDYDLSPSLPGNLDDLRASLLADGRVWVVGGQLLGGQTIDLTWLVTLDAAGDPVAVKNGPPLGLPGGMSDHVLIATRWGLVAAGGESETQHHDSELRSAVLLDPDTLTVRNLPDLSVPHDDAAGVAWNGTLIILGGQAPGSLFGVTVPTPVRAVEMLVRDAVD